MSHYHIVSTAVEFMQGREYLHHLVQVLPATPIPTGTMSSHGRAYNALGHRKPAVHAISVDLLVICQLYFQELTPLRTQQAQDRAVLSRQ